jgi:hypothetical protein
VIVADLVVPLEVELALPAIDGPAVRATTQIVVAAAKSALHRDLLKGESVDSYSAPNLDTARQRSVRLPGTSPFHSFSALLRLLRYR